MPQLRTFRRISLSETTGGNARPGLSWFLPHHGEAYFAIPGGSPRNAAYSTKSSRFQALVNAEDVRLSPSDS